METLKQAVQDIAKKEMEKQIGKQIQAVGGIANNLMPEHIQKAGEIAKNLSPGQMQALGDMAKNFMPDQVQAAGEMANKFMPGQFQPPSAPGIAYQPTPGQPQCPSQQQYPNQQPAPPSYGQQPAPGQQQYPNQQPAPPSYGQQQAPGQQQYPNQQPAPPSYGQQPAPVQNQCPRQQPSHDQQLDPRQHSTPGHPGNLTVPLPIPPVPLIAPLVAPIATAPSEPNRTHQQTQRGLVWIRTTPQEAHALSDRAVVAGYEGYDQSPLWVIRTNCKGDLLPGKLAVKHHIAYVPWGCEEHVVNDIEVCCAHPEEVYWIESRDGNVPPNAVPGGKTESGETLYIGRAKHDGSLTPGKVHPSHRLMYMSYDGIEVIHRVYDVLCAAYL